MKTKAFLLAAACAMLSLTSPSHAALTITVQTISSTQAIITSTGTMDFSYPFGPLGLGNILINPSDGQEHTLTGSLFLGARESEGASTLVSGEESVLLLNFASGTADEGATLSGSATLTLVGGSTFMPVGTTGQVAAIAFASDAGTYEVTAVPEPTTYAALFATAALGLAAWRRRVTK